MIINEIDITDKPIFITQTNYTASNEIVFSGWNYADLMEQAVSERTVAIFKIKYK